MLFTSINFFALVAVTFLLYYCTKEKRLQVAMLILASFIFYAWNYPLLLALLLISILINAVTSFIVNSSSKQTTRRIAAISGVTSNLFILGFFKYSPLVGKTFFEGQSIGEFLISIPLPIGISFYTFQGISLLIDTFRSQERIQRHTSLVGSGAYLRDITLFIAFFPQLVAGPIVKAREFLPQISAKHLSQVNWEKAFKDIVAGYFLKMVVADNLKDHTFWIAYPQFASKSIVELTALLFGYSMQIFADFAGYSLIAIGIAGLFGYQLMDNFCFPYISTSFSEFWRRWHISLSTFLKEYLYIPLGGNRKGRGRTYVNLLLTMILGGLWHGAAWSYAVWGAYHGLALALERLAMDRMPQSSSWVPKALKGVIVFSLVTLGWLLFKLSDFSHVLFYLECLIRNDLFYSTDLLTLFFIGVYSLPVVVYHLLYLWKDSLAFRANARFQYLMYGLIFFMILLNQGSSGEFIYFQF